MDETSDFLMRNKQQEREEKLVKMSNKLPEDGRPVGKDRKGAVVQMHNVFADLQKIDEHV